MSDIKTIKIKRGLTAGNVPSSLSFGELAVNTFDRTLFVGGITGGVLEYPLQKTYVYNTYSDFVADIDAGVYGTAGNEAHFQYGDLFIERNTSYVYSFLPSTTGATSIGTWGIVSGVSGSSVTNYVSSWNGLTGAINYSLPLASSSVTGVASFNNEFVVSGIGSVGLTSNYVKSINGFTGAVTLEAEGNISIGVSGGNILFSYAPPESPLLGSPSVTIRSYSLDGAPTALSGYLWFNIDDGVLYTGYSGDSAVYWVQAASINNNIAS